MGWHLGVTNLPEPFIKCWINEVTYGNVNQTICDQATDPDNEFIADQLSEVSFYWALCTSIFGIGAAIGGLIGGPFSDKFGRKTTMIWNAIFAFILCLLLGATRFIGNYPIFVIARTLIGLQAGITSSAAPVYLNEVTPEEEYGKFGTGFSLVVCSGILFSQVSGLTWLLGTNDLWPYTFIVGMVPVVINLCLAFVCPESPSWLARHGKIQEAIKADATLRGKDHIRSEKYFKNLATEREEGPGLLQNIKDLYRDPPVRSAISNVIMYQIIQQLSGINAIFFYSGGIFFRAGIPNEYSGLATVGLGIINVIGVFMAVNLVDRLGRIKLFFWSMIGIALMTVLMTVLLTLETDNEVITYLSIAPTLLYVLIFEIGVGPIPWMIACEIVPDKYKAGSAAIGATVNWFFAFLVGLIFPPLNDWLDSYVFIIFTATCILGALYIRFLGVESKGRNIDEIMEVYCRKAGVAKKSYLGEDGPGGDSMADEL